MTEESQQARLRRPRQEGLAGGGWQQADLVPRPDPTELTNRAIELVTEQYRRDLKQLRELLETRLDCMDSAAQTHLRETSALRAQVEEKITHLRELAEEKFDGIDRRFEDRDAGALANMTAAEKALAAALESARQLTELQNRSNRELAEQQDKANQDAISKTQTATSEQIRALDQLSSSRHTGVMDKIEDARTRLTAIESLTRGISEAGGERREERGLQNSTITVSLVAFSVILSAVALIVTLILHK